MAEEIDVLIRPKDRREEATARFVSLVDELGREVGTRVFVSMICPGCPG